MTTYKQLPQWGSAYWQDPVATSTDLPTTDPNGTVRLALDTGTIYEWNGSSWNSVGSASEVLGPGSSTDNAMVRFDGTTGKLIQNSGVIVDDSNNVSGLGTISGGAITSSSLTVSTAVYADASKVLTSSSTTSTELGYVHGVTSAIQTQIDGKEPTITTLSVAKGGTNSGTALNNNRIMQSSSGSIVEASAITASRALISDANGIPTHASTTSTEIGYFSGVTSALQTQIDTKAAGAASSTDNAVARFDSTTGKVIQNSGVIIDDSNNVTGVAQINATLAKVGATGSLSSGATMEVAGTSGGFLLPRLTSTQRDALTATNGLCIYNSTTDRPQCYVAGAWTDLIGWGA